MVLKTIYIARHGYRANWLPPPHPPNPTGVDSDPPLADHGVDQAKQLAAYLTGLPSTEKPEFILSSPFYRCVQTAQPIAEMLSIPIVLERGVGEWYKKGRATVPEPADYDLLTQFFSALSTSENWQRDGLGVIPNLEGESEEEIFDRALEFWEKFIPEFEKRYPETEIVLIMTHAATKIALGMSLLGHSSVHDYLDKDKNRLRAGACSLDKYTVGDIGDDTSKKPLWELKMNGNTEFLAKGEEMHWNFQLGFEAGSDEDIKARAFAKSASGTPEPKEEVEMEDLYVTVDIPIIGESKFSQFDDPSNPKLFQTKTSNLNKQSTKSQSLSNLPKNGSNKPDVTHQLTQELASQKRSNVIKPTSEFQVAGLDYKHPLIKLSNNADINNSSSSSVDGKIYQGKWQSLVGTDMVFSDSGELIGVVREHIHCDDNNVLIAKESNIAENDDEIIEAAGKEDEALTNLELGSNATSLLKKVYAIAKKQEV